MRSTRLLFNACKPAIAELALCSAGFTAVVCMGWLLAEALPFSTVPPMYAHAFYLTVLAASVVAAFQPLSKLHGALLHLPVPVTPRQSAFVPLLAALVSWGLAQGVLCLFIFIDTPTNAIEALSAIQPAMLNAVPFALFLIALGNWNTASTAPVSLLSPVVVFFPAFLLLLAPFLHELLYLRYGEYFRWIQGAQAVAALLLVWSAPARRHTWDCAALRRHPVLQFHVRTPGEPMPFRPLTAAVDLSVFLLGLGALLVAGSLPLLIIAPGFEGRVPSWQEHLAIGAVAVYFTAGIGLKLAHMRLTAIRRGSAPPYAQLSQWALRIFHGIGRWRTRLSGTPSGDIVHCRACNRYEPAWDRSCGAGVTQKTGGTESGWSTRLPADGYAPYLFSSVIICGVLILPVAGPEREFANAGDVDHVDNASGIRVQRYTFNTVASTRISVAIPPESVDSAAAETRKILGAHPEPTSWAAAASTPDDTPIAIPSRFRVSIRRDAPDSFSVTATSLRWEHPEVLATGMATLLAEGIGGTVRAPAVSASWMAVPRVSTAYLDNGIHWIGNQHPAAPRAALPLNEDRPIYVDLRNVRGWENGKTWATAYDTLQEGINAAYRRQVAEVWVARGIYDENRLHYGALRLRDGVRVYGGFVGRESARDERDTAANLTVIDGAMAQRGAPARTVVDASANALLDGFTITGARAPGMVVEISGSLVLEDYGGGMTIRDGAPEIRDCHFLENTAGADGGAILVEGGSPLVVGCVFTRNAASGEGGAIGMTGGTIALDGCAFEENRAGTRGGAIVISSSPRNASSGVIEHCRFNGNSAPHGGAVLIASGKAAIHASIFRANRATRGAAVSVAVNAWGAHLGGLANKTEEEIESYWREKYATLACDLSNCIIVENVAEEASSVIGSGIFTLENCTVAGNTSGDHTLFHENLSDRATITNTILWNNGPGTLPEEATVRHSIIQGGHPGNGNRNTDPLFVDPDNGDYRLRAGSPAIDAGTAEDAPAVDLDGTPRPQGNGNDMGAYEYVPK